MINSSRSEYIAKCRNEFESFACRHRYLMRHVRKDNKPIGTIILWRKFGVMYIGWSKHNKLDIYNRYIGIAKALDRASCDWDSSLPRQLRDAYNNMVDFANTAKGFRCLGVRTNG